RHQAFVWSAAAVFVLSALSALASLALSNQRPARERDVARAQRKRARDAVDTTYTQVAEKGLAVQPEMEEVQREFLRAAVDFYREFAQEESTEPEHQFQTALANQRVGRIQTMIFGKGKEAETQQALRKAIAILEKLSQEFPAKPEYADQLAQSYFYL